MPNDEEELVIDGIVEKLSVVGNPANGETWMLFKNQEKENEKVDTKESKEESKENMDKAKGGSGEGTGSDARSILSDLIEGEPTYQDVSSALSSINSEFDADVNRDPSTLQNIASGNIQNPPEELVSALRQVNVAKSLKNSFTEGGSGDMADQTDEGVEGSEEEVEKEETPEEESSSEDESDDLLKNLDAEEIKELKKKADKADELEEKVDQALEKAEREEDLRKQKDYEDLAKSEYSSVSKEASELGPILRKVDENLDEDTAEDVKSLIKTGFEQAEEAGLYDEFGSGKEGNINKSKFEQRVEQVRKEQGIDIHKARSLVMEDSNEPNPQR